MSLLNALSLCSGIGGMDLACEWAGIYTVALCEKDAFCQSVLRHHWPGVLIYDDLYQLTKARMVEDGIPPIDLITAGFPCQPFSVAGKRRGTRDDRYLWPEIARIVGEVRPAWLVAENVAGILSMEQSDRSFVMEDEDTVCEEADLVIETIRKDLESQGYDSVPIVIPACAVGAKHRRDRVFIVGHADHHGQFTDAFRRVAAQDGGNPQEQKSAVWAEGSGRQQADGVMADTAGFRQPRPREFIESVYSKSMGSRKTSESLDVCLGAEWATEPGLGGSLDGLSRWLDGYPWPTALGEEQYEWEPPRVQLGMKQRKPRLQALGNAVVPQQIFVILYAIRQIHEWLSTNKALPKT